MTCIYWITKETLTATRSSRSTSSESIRSRWTPKASTLELVPTTVRYEVLFSFVATNLKFCFCSQVHISCLYAEDDTVLLNLERQIKCIELDPLHHKSGLGRRFIVGDYQLTLYEKTFLKGLKSTVLSDSEGLVNAVKWNGQFVAWASGIGVRVYDLNEKCSLGLIKWEEPKTGRLSDFRCNLRWCNASTLLIGWVETIRICVIRKRNLVEVSTRNLPGFIVDPISTFQTEFFVCGLAPLEKNQLVVLGVPKEKNEDKNYQRPVLCAIRYESNVYEELCTDSLTLKG